MYGFHMQIVGSIIIINSTYLKRLSHRFHALVPQRRVVKQTQRHRHLKVAGQRMEIDQPLAANCTKTFSMSCHSVFYSACSATIHTYWRRCRCGRCGRIFGRSLVRSPVRSLMMSSPQHLRIHFRLGRRQLHHPTLTAALRRQRQRKHTVHEIERFTGDGEGARMRCRVQKLVLRPPRCVLGQIVDQQPEAGDVGNVDARIVAGGRRSGRRVQHVHDGCNEQRRSDLVLVDGEAVAQNDRIGVQIEDDQLRRAVLHICVADFTAVQHPEATTVVDLGEQSITRVSERTTKSMQQCNLRLQRHETPRSDHRSCCPGLRSTCNLDRH